MTPVINFINILQAAFAPNSCPKKFQSQTVIREKLRQALSDEKVEHKMLMKLTHAPANCEGNLYCKGNRKIDITKM